MSTMKLPVLVLIIAALMFSQVCAGFAGWDDPIICVTKALIDGKYVFKVQRVKDAFTGELPNYNEISFDYKIQCDTDTNKVLKIVEGTSAISAGENHTNIDLAELVEEMRAELPKYTSITIFCTLKNVKGASLGTIDQIIINNTSDMHEEDVEALQDALNEMFGNMEEKSGRTDASDDGANVLKAGPPAFKGASSWAAAELEKAAGYGFITDSIKDNMSAPITREEFAEVAVRLYEKYSGRTADANADNTIPKEDKSTLDTGTSGASELRGQAEAGYEKLPASFPKVVPILPDAIIATADGFKGDKSGFIMYATDYSADDAIKFYSNESLYKGFISLMPLENQSAKSIMVKIEGYEMMISASEDSRDAEGKTTIVISVFGTGFAQG